MDLLDLFFIWSFLGKARLPIKPVTMTKLVRYFPGSVVGQAIADHPKIRKLGFTGSTPVGKAIMERWVLAWSWGIRTLSVLCVL